jgi:transposase
MMMVMAGRQYRKRSTAVERAAALAAYESSGKSARVLADELGVSQKTLESWIRSERRRLIDPVDDLSKDQLDEIVRLRRKLREAERDIAFLKKADAFFRESDRRENDSR